MYPNLERNNRLVAISLSPSSPHLPSPTMAQLHSLPNALSAGSATSTGQETAINATQGRETLAPAGDGLPDLSRLSLGNAPALGLVLLGTGLHIAVYTQGAPITINVYNGGGTVSLGPTAEANRTPHVIRSQVHAAPPLPPVRIPAPTHPGATAGIGMAHTPAPAPTNAAAVAQDTAPPAVPNMAVPGGAPPSPAMQGVDAIFPPSPQLQSVPDSAAVLMTAVLPFEAYEDIAPRDPLHNRWYVVTTGRRVGIWREWHDMADHVLRVPGNQHKSFGTRAEAEQYYYGNKATGNVHVILP
ncbi:hypothetical protein C8T65DRAFT_747186 [Cerioporus squamosus]|nr:hypothetical protein C8T65DRAFT_747186 [Cerioporus squamosus]